MELATAAGATLLTTGLGETALVVGGAVVVVGGLLYFMYRLAKDTDFFEQVDLGELRGLFSFITVETGEKEELPTVN